MNPNLENEAQALLSHIANTPGAPVVATPTVAEQQQALVATPQPNAQIAHSTVPIVPQAPAEAPQSPVAPQPAQPAPQAPAPAAQPVTLPLEAVGAIVGAVMAAMQPQQAAPAPQPASPIQVAAQPQFVAPTVAQAPAQAAQPNLDPFAQRAQSLLNAEQQAKALVDAALNNGIR